MSPAQILPHANNLFPAAKFAERHPNLLNANRVAWAVRHRRVNGLAECGGTFESPLNQVLINEPAFLAWLVGLAGRKKPRSARRRARAS